ncbi:DUF262 domain-containing protein [Mucilaginibacter sp. SJ]|uniref:DUF262 domain-containing protein n=1 Tax=Mucilaginibacter sp. SJ TaxID=3029053 RepID=UPI0023A940A4|nr:DUF262 domain-containing protein [Mucilaginibacter sp. SJ]WEA00714.1 DUF262 domain-containing protein [Mucilaginibacter sp. SJ]
MIQTASCSLDTLFNGRVNSKQEDGSLVSFSGRLNVPEYQRPYLWGKRETDRLLNDLTEYLLQESDERPDYYLGSIILHRKGDSLNIIDGQQRLTTIALLLTAINISEVPAIDYSSPSSTQQIRENYKYLLTRAEEFRPLYWRIREHVNVTLVVTDREDDAYTFFETQNTDGVRLSGVDIIKAYHLRAIKNSCSRSRAAVRWEKHNELDKVAILLLKARYWNCLRPRSAPGRNQKRAIKNAIVGEFSERTRKGHLPDVGFVFAKVQSTGSGIQTTLPNVSFAIRQPLNDGENLVDYMVAFSNLYSEVLPYKDGEWKDQSYESFINSIIKPVDGTLFLKELFEISLLCYAHRFGTEKLYEAALWLFRCTYEPRLKNPKTVKEVSVPEFLRGYPVVDIILNAFDHRELMEELKSFKATVNHENLTGNTVKRRYLQRLTEFFKISFHLDADAIDPRLKEGIISLIQ